MSKRTRPTGFRSTDTDRRLAGEVQSRRRSARIELTVSADGLAGWKDLHVDPASAQLLDGFRIGTHLPVRSHADDQRLREVLEHLLQVLHHEGVPVLAPPVAH